MFTKTNDLRKLVDMIVKRKLYSLIVTGKSGSGKSRTVIDQLAVNTLEQNKDWILIKSYSTVKSIYQSLWENNGAILVYDDCDSVLDNRDGINIFKGALDSGDTRSVSWMSSTNTFNPNGMNFRSIENMINSTGFLPNHFDFVGCVIFISNYTIDKIDEALLSRSVTIDISPTFEEFVDIIQTNIAIIEPEVPIPMKVEVLNWFVANKDKIDQNNFNLRTYIHAVKFKVDNPNNWINMLEYV